MFNSSFLNSSNKASLERTTSFRAIFGSFILILISLLIIFVVPLGLYLLEKTTDGDSRIITWLVVILSILFIPFLLIYGFVILKNFIFTSNLFIDVKKDIKKVIITSGEIEIKSSKKTWGPILDEYSIKLKK